MELFDISWPATSTHCCGRCQAKRSKRSRNFIRIRDIKQSGESGCPKCLLIHKIMLQHHPEDLKISIEEDSNGIISLCYLSNPKSIRLITRTRLFYLCGTPKPTWDFIKPGNLFLSNRREELSPLLNGWIDNCNSNHSDCTSPNSILPKRVLDVGTNTAKPLLLHISSGESAPYVALSHCWGPNGIQLKTTTSTIKNHQQGINFQQLPKNFQDAVTVTRSIGIRYLWVDSLCIVQDNITDWEIESSKMSSIYRDAYLVISATQAADPFEGFLDRKDEPENFGEGFVHHQLPVRDYPVQTGRIRNSDSTISRIYIQRVGLEVTGERHHNTVISSPLNQRAWVLQENILPRRIVHFTFHEVLWECIKCLKCECMEVDELEVEKREVNLIRESHFFDFNKHLTYSSITLQTSWLGLLETSCRLAISYESDRLPALSGIANLWKLRGAGRYLAGLWEDNILESLMWKPSADDEIHDWKEYVAPSWSPFALGYTMKNRRSVSAAFEFPSDYHGISEECAKVVDACCTSKGKDGMGAVKDGYLVLWTLVAEVCPEDAPEGAFVWDRGIEYRTGQRLTLILIGYFEFYPPIPKCPRGIVTVPSKRIVGAYERIGRFSPYEGSKPDKWLKDCFQNMEKQNIKIVW